MENRQYMLKRMRTPRDKTERISQNRYLHFCRESTGRLCVEFRLLQRVTSSKHVTARYKKAVYKITGGMNSNKFMAVDIEFGVQRGQHVPLGFEGFGI